MMNKFCSRLCVIGILITLTIASLSVVSAQTWLFYDDGTEGGNYNCASTYRDLAVKFTLPEGWTNAKLLTVSAFKTASEISGSTGNLIVHVLSSDFSTELASFPFTLDAPGGVFRSVSVPDDVEVPSVFYIMLEGNPEACIGVDSSSGGHSYSRDDGGEWTPEPMEVMVRVEVESILAPVGGTVSPINKLALLTPYLALVGLIAVTSIVYVIKKSHN
jgi:hypothetical protein